jgi:hypothetical protein
LQAPVGAGAVDQLASALQKNLLTLRLEYE